MKMLRSRSLAFLSLTLAVVSFAAWSCGGGQQNSGTGNPSPTSQAPPADEAPAPSTTGAAPSGSGEVSLAVGDAVFKQRCEMCHGPSGAGDGPAGAALNPRPRNFNDKAYMASLSDEQIQNTILNGKPGTAMPPHKGLVTESEVKSLVLKVRSFSK